MKTDSIPTATVTVALIDNHPHVVAKQGGREESYPCASMVEADLVRVEVEEWLRTRRL